MLNLDSLNKSMKSFDWRSLQKFANPQAADDLNAFLEKLPQNTSQSLLIVAGVIWAAAGALGLFATVKIQTLTELRAELQEAESLKPIVPVIRDVAVNAKDVEAFVKEMSKVYSGVNVKANGAAVLVTAKSTGLFGQFREAVGHVQNGGSGWRVSVERLCVGRECDKQPLAAALKINKVSVDKPG